MVFLVKKQNIKKSAFELNQRRIFSSINKYYLLTVFARSAPALNLATFLAAILIAFPV